jgi:hypothetical protein
MFLYHRVQKGRIQRITDLNVPGLRKRLGFSRAVGKVAFQLAMAIRLSVCCLRHVSELFGFIASKKEEKKVVGRQRTDEIHSKMMF